MSVVELYFRYGEIRFRRTPKLLLKWPSINYTNYRTIPPSLHPSGHPANLCSTGYQKSGFEQNKLSMYRSHSALVDPEKSRYEFLFY